MPSKVFKNETYIVNGIKLLRRLLTMAKMVAYNYNWPNCLGRENVFLQPVDCDIERVGSVDQGELDLFTRINLSPVII